MDVTESPMIINLKRIAPKSVKDLSVPEIFKALESSNQAKEVLFTQMEEDQASNLINTIEGRILKEIQLNEYPLNLTNYITILSFYGRHQSGSIKLFTEVEARVIEILKLCQNQSLTINIKTLGKLISASILSNNFNKPYYQTINSSISDLLSSEEQSPSSQSLSDFINALYLLARKPGCDGSALLLILQRLINNEFSQLNLETTANLIWTLFLKTNFASISNKTLRFSVEDIEQEAISKYFEPLLQHFRNKLSEKSFMAVSSLPLSLKYKLKQIGLILEALEPKATLTDPTISALSALKLPSNPRKYDTSLIHDDVTAILRAMQWEIEREKNVLMYECDLFFSPDVVIEVNGPSHYIGYDHNCSIDDLDGKTLMRYKTLLVHGYKVKSISYKEWYSLKGATNKMNFIADKIYNQQI